MSQLKSGVILRPGEELVIEMEAQLWASSSNPIAKLIGSILKFLYMLIGVRRDGYVVLTNQRVIEVISCKACWVFNTSKNVRYVLSSSVKEVGYNKEGTFLGCFCQNYVLYYDSFTQRTAIQLDIVGGDSEAQALVDKFYATISAAQ